MAPHSLKTAAACILILGCAVHRGGGWAGLGWAGLGWAGLVQDWVYKYLH